MFSDLKQDYLVLLKSLKLVKNACSEVKVEYPGLYLLR